MLAFHMGYVDQKAVTALDMLRSLWPGLQGIRLMGSAALGLAYAASGRVDLYFHHNLSPWDIASGLLLASEAGGVVVDRNGNPATLGSESVILANPGLVARFWRPPMACPGETGDSSRRQAFGWLVARGWDPVPRVLMVPQVVQYTTRRES